MTKLGIAVTDLGASQLNYCLIHNANHSLREHSNLDIIVFYENVCRPLLKPEFALMNIAEAWNYDGIVIATNLSTAGKLIGMPGPVKRYFYCFDLEWIDSRKSYRDLQAVYGGDIQLIARCEEHKKALEDAWNRPVLIMGDFQLDRLIGKQEIS